MVHQNLSWCHIMESNENEMSNALEMHEVSSRDVDASSQHAVDKENTLMGEATSGGKDDESSQLKEDMSSANESQNRQQEPIELSDATILSTVPSMRPSGVSAAAKRNVAVKNSQAFLAGKITQMKTRLNSTSSVSSITISNNEHVIIDDDNDELSNDILPSKQETAVQQITQVAAQKPQQQFARKSTAPVPQSLINQTVAAAPKLPLQPLQPQQQQVQQSPQQQQQPPVSLIKSTLNGTSPIAKSPLAQSTTQLLAQKPKTVTTPVVTPIATQTAPASAASLNNGSQTTTIGGKQFKNKIVSCKPFYQSKATECYPVSKDASTQIDLDELKPTHSIVPVPVPLNVPLPMCMYQAPMPVPMVIPVPIPVPVFIPTTKRTFDRVQRRIEKLRKKLPSDPSEFQLLLYAEKLAREEGIPGFESSSDGESDTESSQRKEKYQKKEEPPSQLILSDQEGTFKWMYGVRTFNNWLTAKGADGSLKVPNDMLKLRNDELNTLLAEFIHATRKPNGEMYAPESIYYLCLGIQHYLQENGRVENIFLDAIFERFQESLNEIAVKYQIRLSPDGQIISRIEEEILWESKQLGAHSPFVLLNTILYFNTKYFFLDKVESHLQLSFTNVKKHSKRNIGPNGEEYGKTAYLRYYPDFQGIEQVIYEQGENYDNPLRCPVKLYEFYLSKCPESVKNRSDLFYLLPEKACIPNSPVWFSSQPLNAKILERMLNRIKMVKEVNELLIAAATPQTTAAAI